MISFIIKLAVLTRQRSQTEVYVNFQQLESQKDSKEECKDECHQF